MKNFLYILMFIGNVGFISLLLLSFRLNFNEWFGTSLIIGYFYTKNIIDKQDLENKIFELKELIEKSAEKK